MIQQTSASSSSFTQRENRLLLGSGSQTRKLILKEMGFSFDTVKANVNEKLYGDRFSGADKAQELVLLLANVKVARF